MIRRLRWKACCKCNGRYLSEQLWLTYASLLATFNIEKAKDDSGRDIPISDEYQEFGFISHKTPFECWITPRSHGHRQLIEEVNLLNK
ncbi:hypothetical protein M413DRAFT_80198 [Hebeloma cylindrosporum]|uniref:Uncharacterized protein n=1 Tax=Hebeloma cylindrosporum TaxID=76867 RepID=A0A0C3BTI9_HEBCY|nr:hypothetical protein M413DRAFT_80198 [Hebeloma cylindrosporum h7]